MGDVYKNITASNLTVRSKVDHSFNDAKDKVDSETARFLSEVADEIKKANDERAANLYRKFTSELQDPTPSKSALRGFWDDILEVVPTVGTIAGAAGAIAKLLG